MAKIGLRNFLYGILTEAVDGTPSYGVAKKPAKAISCKVDLFLQAYPRTWVPRRVSSLPRKG